MKDAFMSMGTFGKVVAVLIVAASAKAIISDIAVTIAHNREARK